MTETANGHDAAQAVPTPDQVPALVVAEVLHWGASPEGDEVVVFVKTVTGQTVRIATPSIEALTSLVETLKLARAQAQRNAAKDGDAKVAPRAVGNLAVGMVTGTAGVVVVLEPGTPDETAYIFEPHAAFKMAELLASEAGRQLHNVKGVAVPRRPGVLLGPNGAPLVRSP